jgi:hypothetical protein
MRMRETGRMPFYWEDGDDLGSYGPQSLNFRETACCAACGVGGSEYDLSWAMVTRGAHWSPSDRGPPRSTAGLYLLASAPLLAGGAVHPTLTNARPA